MRLQRTRPKRTYERYQHLSVSVKGRGQKCVAARHKCVLPTLNEDEKATTYERRFSGGRTFSPGIIGSL